MKALAAVSMWDLCMEKGSGDLDQFQKVNRLISDQLFSNFVSEPMSSRAAGTPLGLSHPWVAARVTQPRIGVSTPIQLLPPESFGGCGLRLCLEHNLLGTHFFQPCQKRSILPVAFSMLAHLCRVIA